MEFFHLSLKRSLKWFWYLICQISFQRIFQSENENNDGLATDWHCPGNSSLRTVWYNLQFQNWMFLQFVETFLESIFQILESLQLPLRHDGHQPLRLQSIYQLSKICTYRGSQIMDLTFAILLLFIEWLSWSCIWLFNFDIVVRSTASHNRVVTLNNDKSTYARYPRNKLTVVK